MQAILVPEMQAQSPSLIHSCIYPLFLQVFTDSLVDGSHANSQVTLQNNFCVLDAEQEL